MTQIPDADFQLCFTRGFLWRIALTAGFILLVFFAGRVLLVVFAGILLAVGLRAVTDYFHSKLLLGERWAYPVVLASACLIIGGAIYFLGPRILGQLDQLATVIPQSAANIRHEIDRFEWGHRIIKAVSRGIPIEAITQRFSYWATTAIDQMALVFAVVAIGVFTASDPSLYKRGALQLVPANHRSRAADLLQDIALTLKWWLIGQLVPMIALGIGSMIGLWLLGIPLAFTLALFTASMLFIPYVGSVIAYIPTVLVALMVGPKQAIYVTILYLGVHGLEGYVITPITQHRAVRLPPALTLVSQLFMWTVAGVLGIAVATPLAAMGMVAVQKIYLEEEPRAKDGKISDDH